MLAVLSETMLYTGTIMEEKKEDNHKQPMLYTGTIIEEKKDDNRKQQPKRTWGEFYQALCVYKSAHNDCNVPQRYNKDRRLGAWVGEQRRDRNKLSEEQRDQLDNLGFNWETRQEKEEREWHDKFERLKAYRKEYGDCRVSSKSVKEDMAAWVEELGNWVRVQRRRRKKGKMSAEQEQKLNEIGFDWVLRTVERGDRSKIDEKWQRNYIKLVAFYGEHKHCMVPCFYEKDKKLGKWVGMQRRLYKDNEIPEDRKKALNALGFVWKIDHADAEASLNQRQWDERFQQLVQFKKEYGHVYVKRNFNNWGLGTWLGWQREKGRKGDLDERRASRLLSIGVKWRKSHDECWEEHFAKLITYKTEHGHFRVSRSESVALQNWVRNQRESQEKGTLLPERKNKLDSIGFTWKIERKRKRIATTVGQTPMQHKRHHVLPSLLADFVATERNEIQNHVLPALPIKGIKNQGHEIEKHVFPTREDSVQMASSLLASLVKTDGTQLNDKRSRTIPLPVLPAKEENLEKASSLLAGLIATDGYKPGIMSR